MTFNPSPTKAVKIIFSQKRIKPSLQWLCDKMVTRDEHLGLR